MNKIDIAKTVISTIVGTGSSKIVHGIIANNVPIANNIDKVTVASASAVIGYAASDISKNYTNAKVDEVVAWWKKIQTKSDTDKTETN